MKVKISDIVVNERLRTTHFLATTIYKYYNSIKYLNPSPGLSLIL